MMADIFLYSLVPGRSLSLSFGDVTKFRAKSVILVMSYKGCILLGLFSLFLFRFRNNRIHGISLISKRTLLMFQTEPEVT